MGIFGNNPSGKVTIYHAVTGEAIERWPVDARGMIDCDEYTLTPPSEGAPGPAAGEQEPQGTPEGIPVLHPLSTAEVGVPLTLGEATAAHPIEVPTAATKRGPGRPRKIRQE